jgi:hypothetical protein
VSPRAQNVVRRGSAAAARTVWSRICRQTLADVNGLMFMIQQLLMWDVERAESGGRDPGRFGHRLERRGNPEHKWNRRVRVGNRRQATGDSVNADLLANAIRDVRLSNADP